MSCDRVREKSSESDISSLTNRRTKEDKADQIRFEVEYSAVDYVILYYANSLGETCSD